MVFVLHVQTRLEAAKKIFDYFSRLDYLDYFRHKKIV